jgi:cytochrome c2
MLLSCSNAHADTLTTNALPLEINTLAHSEIIIKAETYIEGDVYVLSRQGDIFTANNGKLIPSRFPSLPTLNGSKLWGDDLKYDEKSGYLYASAVYTVDRLDTAIISRLDTSRQDARWEEIYRSDSVPPDYIGNTLRIALLGRMLYTNIGAEAFDLGPNPPAQDEGTARGKLIAIDLANHFETAVISKGHRAVEGLLVDSKGALWATDNAQRGGDKLEKIALGQNYGWPFTMLGTHYFTYRSATDPYDAERNITAPVYSWVPSIAPSALIEVHDFDPAWDGDLLVGSFKAQSLYRIRLDGDRVVFAEPIWIGHRIRDIISRPGEIVVATDEGSLLRIEVAAIRSSPSRQLNETGGSNRVFAFCMNCHSFTRQDATTFGPSLQGVLGRRIGGDAYAYYSNALRNREGVWTDDLLTAFLLSPRAFAPGTTMPDPGLDEASAAEVVAALKALQPQQDANASNQKTR